MVLSLGALALLVTVMTWVAIAVFGMLAAPDRGEPPPDVPSQTEPGRG
ncbi:hypothetical protein [Cellulomonas septica]|nr:hypothetical protein [Cellulomonas septica]